MPQSQNSQLEGGQELAWTESQFPYLGQLVRRIINSINLTAKNASVSSVGKLSPPNPIDAVNVQGTLSNGVLTAPSEILHWTINHNQELSKGVRYFSEIDTDPNFTQPHVIEHGASRSGFLTLPSKDSNGAQQTYYLRSYPQYHGSDPAKPTTFGGITGAIKIQMTGSSKTTLLSSTGSGTAATTGQQGGQGLGKVLTRPAPGPRRNLL